jgi:hypothetical protein
VEGRRLALFRFGLEAAANAVGTLVAAGIIYLVVVLSGLVQTVNTGTLLASITSTVAGAATAVGLWRMARRVRKLAEDAANFEEILWTYNQLPKDEQEQFLELLTRGVADKKRDAES